MADTQIKDETCVHRTVNATKWMKDTVKEFVESKGFHIVFFDVNCEIMIRFGEKATINTIKLKLKDEKNNIYSIDDYSSMTTEESINNSHIDIASGKSVDNKHPGNYIGEDGVTDGYTRKDYDTNLTWLIKFIKEKEKDVLRKTLSNEDASLLDGPDNKTAQTEGSLNKHSTGLLSEYKIGSEKKFGNLKFELFLASNIKDMIRFLTEKEFIMYWAGTTAVFEDNSVKFENIILEDIKVNENIISMMYKWKDWEEFSSVLIKFDQIGDSLKVILTQKNIPVSFVDNVRNHWNSRIFEVISSIFRCAIKPAY